MSKRKNVDEHNESHKKHLKVKEITIGQLLRACESNNIGCVKDAIQKKLDLNTIDDNGWTPLHYACFRGHIDIVRELCLQKVDIDTRDATGYTPFHIACYQGHNKVVRELIKLGADFEKPNNKKQSPFYTAYTYGHDDIVQELCNYVNTSEIVAHLFKGSCLMNTIFFEKIEKEYVKIIHLLLFGQKQPESPLSVLHRDLLQDIQKIIKEKLKL